MAELTSSEVLAKIKPSNLLLHHPASNNLSDNEETSEETIVVVLTSQYQPQNGKGKYSGNGNLYWSSGLLQSITSYHHKVMGGSGANIEYSSKPSINTSSNSIYVAFTGPETDSELAAITIVVYVTFSYTLPKSVFSGKALSLDYGKYCCCNMYFYNSKGGTFTCKSLNINPLSDPSEGELYTKDENYFVTLSIDGRNHTGSILFDDEFNGNNSTIPKNLIFKSGQTEFYLELVSYYAI